MLALTTINAAKEQNVTYQPILFADFLFVDGSTFHASTHPMAASEGGVVVPPISLGGTLGMFAGGTYTARLSQHNIAQIQSLSQQGISLIPSVTLAVEDPDAAIYLANERTIGFRGAVMTLTLAFCDMGSSTFSSDARYIFAGVCEKPSMNSAQMSITAVSEVGKKTLPSAIHQRTCIWLNPTTAAQRLTADNPDSIYYRCGATGDLTTEPPCQYTTATCTRPNRRANITWDPISQQFVKSYADGKNFLVQNTLSQGVIGQSVPIVIGTGWINAKPIATVGDGNYTRFEAIANLGPIRQIKKFVVAGEELAPANNQDGSSNGSSNRDFRFNWINNGRRDGAGNLDTPWGNGTTSQGDPYGSLAALMAVVYKDVASANSAPDCKILATGGGIWKFQAITSISVTGGIATATLANSTANINELPQNLIVSGNTLSGVNGSYSSSITWDYNLPVKVSFPYAGSGSGTGGFVRYQAVTTNPVWAYMFIRNMSGENYNKFNLASACAAAAICDEPITIAGSTAVAYLGYTPGDTFVDVITTDGFPSSGQVQIESEIFSYSSLGVGPGPSYPPRIQGLAHVAGISASHAIGVTVKDTVSAATRPRYSTNLVIQDKRAVADICRGIQAASNMNCNRNTSTGLYEIYIDDTMPDSQPAPVSGSNYNTPIVSVDRSGNSASGYSAYRFDELTDMLENSNGGSSLVESQRAINDFPNKMTIQFADESQTYANSSISAYDLDDVYRVGQEIPGSPAAMPEGMTSYDQALCQLRLLLAKSLHGNEAGDGRGTREFTFSTTFKALHLRLGHIIIVNSARLGLTNQPCRITALQPTTNWEDCKITCSWHSDAWYVKGYGRKLAQTPSNRRIAQVGGVPLQWSPNQDGTSSDAVLPSSYKTFGVGVTYTANADGSKAVKIAATGEAPINQFSSAAQSPVISLDPVVSATLGSISGAQSYFIAVAAKDASGLLSPLSVVSRADVAAASTLSITLPIASWPGTVSGYCVYAGQTAQRLTLQSEASGTPTSVVLSSFTPYGEAAPDANFDHLEADAALCLSNGVAVGQATSTAVSSTVTFNGTPFTGLSLTGRIASVVAADADTRVRNYTITGNTNNTLSFAATPDIQLDDWVCVRSQITVAGLTVTDSLWTFTPHALMGKVLRTIAGSGTPQTQVITDNTATSITVATPWTYTIDSTSIVIVEEPTILSSVRGSRLSTSVRHTAASIAIDTKNYAGKFVRLTCYASDGRNARAAEALALTRDVYIAGVTNPPSGVGTGTPALPTSVTVTQSVESPGSTGSKADLQRIATYTFSGSFAPDSNSLGMSAIFSVWDSSYLGAVPSVEPGWITSGPCSRWGVYDSQGFNSGAFGFIASPQPCASQPLYLAFTVVPYNGANAYLVLPPAPSVLSAFAVGSNALAMVSISGSTVTKVSGQAFSAVMVGRAYLLNGFSVTVASYTSPTVITLTAAPTAAQVGYADFARLPLQDPGLTTMLVRPASGVTITTDKVVAGVTASLLKSVVDLQLVPIPFLGAGTAMLTGTTKFSHTLDGYTPDASVIIDNGIITCTSASSTGPILQISSAGAILQNQPSSPTYAVKVTAGGVKIENTSTGPGTFITSTGVTIASAWTSGGVVANGPNLVINPDGITMNANTAGTQYISVSTTGGLSLVLDDSTYSGFLATSWGGGFCHGIGLIASSTQGATLASDNGILPGAYVRVQSSGTLTLSAGSLTFTVPVTTGHTTTVGQIAVTINGTLRYIPYCS